MNSIMGPVFVRGLWLALKGFGNDFRTKFQFYLLNGFHAYFKCLTKI